MFQNVSPRDNQKTTPFSSSSWRTDNFTPMQFPKRSYSSSDSFPGHTENSSCENYYNWRPNMDAWTCGHACRVAVALNRNTFRKSIRSNELRIRIPSLLHTCSITIIIIISSTISTSGRRRQQQQKQRQRLGCQNFASLLYQIVTAQPAPSTLLFIHSVE